MDFEPKPVVVVADKKDDVADKKDHNVDDEVRNKWFVYDSLNSLAHAHASSIVLKRLFPEETGWPIEMIRVQKQTGGNDCGLFAIGTLIALWRGVDPTTILFYQDDMRRYFNEYITGESLLLDFRYETRKPSAYKERVYVYWGSPMDTRAN